jgi:hypothetical protein
MINELDLKKVPYGVSDFNEFRESNYYFVDKTRYIRDLEKKGRYLFLIRPRRFGKSLFLAIMEAYYDIANKDRFDFFFQGSDIHQNPTGEQNSYMVLKLNFSNVEANIKKVEKSFLNYIKRATFKFILKYRKMMDIDLEEVKSELVDNNSAADVMVVFLDYCSRQSMKLYVIIDEYDNFANTILSSSGEQEFKDITHGEGFFRAFFNVLKGGTTDIDAPISRLFMTGVSPITLDDVTSGFNIASNISLDSDLNDIMGFTKTEVETMIEYYRQAGKIHHSTQELLEIMSQWYNHYRFSIHSTLEVFNTIQVWYFMKEYMVDSQIPVNLIDNNSSIDYGKLRHLIIIDKKGLPETNGNFSKLRHLIETNTVNVYIKQSFPIMQIAESENFYSLLFYFGLLTIKGTTPTRQSILTIPNEFVKRLYYEIIKETYEKTKIFKIEWGEYSNLIEAMAVSGEWKPLVEFIAGRMEASLSLRDLMTGEKALQVFWSVYLGLSPVYNVYSEKEMSQGFSDLVMVPLLIQYPELKYSYLMEFKYIKPSENEKEIPQKIQRLKEEAEIQLNRYSSDEKFQKSLGQTVLKKLILIFSGNRLVHHSDV